MQIDNQNLNTIRMAKPSTKPNLKGMICMVDQTSKLFIKKQHMLNEFIRLCNWNEDICQILRQVQTHIQTNTKPENIQVAEFNIILDYFIANSFDTTNWGFYGITTRTRNWYCFIDERKNSHDMFYLRVNRTGTVSPLYCNYKQTRKAKTIQEAIERFIY